MADYRPVEAPVKDIQQLPLMHPGRPVGRDEVLKELYNYVKEEVPVLVCGQDGIGKTTLAAALGSAYTQQPGGTLWLDVDNPPLAELLVRVGRAYELKDVITSENPLSMVGAVASALMTHKPFIVLDGNINPKVADQFISKCADKLPVMMTHIEAIEGGWATINLDKLDEADAVTLFKQKAGIDHHDNDIDIYGIAKLLEYEPYPMVVAARAMVANKQSPDAYYKTLQQVADTLQDSGPLAALTASYRSLNAALQGLLLMMGATFTGEASAELLSMVSNAPIESINQAMTVLSQLLLVEKFQRAGQPYYRVHPDTYEFLQIWLKGSNRLDGLQEKMREAVLQFAQKYSKDSDIAHTQLAIEMSTFLATAKHASENGDRESANDLVVALTQAGDFVNSRGFVYELLQLRGYASGSTSAFPAYGEEEEDVDAVLEQALEADEEDFDALIGIDDDEDEELDADIWELVDDDAAPVPRPEDFKIPTETAKLQGITVEQLKEALAGAKEQGDKTRQIHIMRAIGKVQIIEEREQEAITSFNEVLSLYEEMEDKDGILGTLDMLSGLLTRTDNSQAAVMHATRGVTLAEELSDQDTRMHLLKTLGDARQDLGETAQSITAFSQALEIARLQADKQNEALILYKLGYAFLDDGSAEQALQTWDQALPLFREQKKRDYEGRVLGGLGSANAELERWAEAMNFYKSAVYIAQEVEDKSEEALQISNLAQALVNANDPKYLPEALTRHRQALHLAYESGNRNEIVSAIVDLVRLMMRSSRLLDITQLLLDDALKFDANDRDVKQLQEKLKADKATATERGVQQAPVSGTARDYAANAYETDVSSV